MLVYGFRTDSGYKTGLERHNRKKNENQQGPRKLINATLPSTTHAAVLQVPKSWIWTLEPIVPINMPGVKRSAGEGETRDFEADWGVILGNVRGTCEDGGGIWSSNSRIFSIWDGCWIGRRWTERGMSRVVWRRVRQTLRTSRGAAGNQCSRLFHRCSAQFRFDILRTITIRLNLSLDSSCRLDAWRWRYKYGIKKHVRNEAGRRWASIAFHERQRALERNSPWNFKFFTTKRLRTMQVLLQESGTSIIKSHCLVEQTSFVRFDRQGQNLQRTLQLSCHRV